MIMGMVIYLLMKIKMKRLYVVYDWNDRPFAECERFRDAYRQAHECLQNNGGYITIDIYMRDWVRGYKHECADGDFYFIDRKWDAFLSSDLADAGILWYSIVPEVHTLKELELFQRVATCFDLTLDEVGLDVYKKFYSFKRKGND